MIIHIDLDCFYAQVEHRRTNIERTRPLAVQQYSSLIAVNYAAREKGMLYYLKGVKSHQL